MPYIASIGLINNGGFLLYLFSGTNYTDITTFQNLDLYLVTMMNTILNQNLNLAKFYQNTLRIAYYLTNRKECEDGYYSNFVQIYSYYC